MQHLYYDLGRQQKGSTAVVTLDRQANVRLMTASNYRSLKAGRQFRFQGGLAKRSPARLSIPSSGHWIVVVDRGADDVRGYSPSLADKRALSTGEFSIEEIADQIAEAVLGPSDAD